MDKKSAVAIGQMKKILEEGDEVRKYVRPKEGIRIYSMSRTLLEEHAIKAGAMYKLGKLVLINVEEFENYIISHRVIWNQDGNEEREDED